MPKSILDRLDFEIERRAGYDYTIYKSGQCFISTRAESELWNLLKELDANSMTEEKAKKILEGYICTPTLYSNNKDSVMAWTKESETVLLDGHFTPDQLKAVAWWMENNTEEKP